MKELMMKVLLYDSFIGHACQNAIHIGRIYFHLLAKGKQKILFILISRDLYQKLMNTN